MDKTIGPQYSYFSPHFAMDPFYNDINFKKKIDMLEMLYEIDRESFKKKVLYIQPKLNVFYQAMLVFKLEIKLDSVDCLDEATTMIAFDKDTKEAFLKTLAQRRRSNKIAAWRKATEDTDRRFFMAVLLNSPDRASAMNLIKGEYPDQDPVSLIMVWIKGLVRDAGVESCDIQEDVIPFIECLIKEYSFEETLVFLSKDYEAGELEKVREQLHKLYIQLKINFIFNALFI